jgi:hypothetical protein
MCARAASRGRSDATCAYTRQWRCVLIAAMQLVRSNEYAFGRVLLLCDLQYYYRDSGSGTADVQLACGSIKTS